ncbi:hypothetical protein GIB67_000398 [Kingdonia uniflora]|uniref:Rad21/Rec8-like protein C-terminal eukaryotic domain-containing protein n=1 Tax=Kingdonia uniflora TaxID=39325 RepID=A0A7J7MQ68_9MAGN|nr:hypothetical protein GIB67_000398 [Kingdonia uniflora]
MSNMKIAHLMELPPVDLTCGLFGYGSKEIYYPAPLMNLWMKYSHLQSPHDSPSVTEATMMELLGVMKDLFPPLDLGMPAELEGQGASERSNGKRLFSSSIQSGSSLAPVAEDIPWDLPEPSFKLRRLFESSPTHDPGPTQTQHPLVNLLMEKVYDAIRMHLKTHFGIPGALQIESLDQLAFGLTQKIATQLFYQTCVLATHDLVKVQQRVAYTDILISRSCKSDLWTYEPSVLSSFSLIHMFF